MFSNNSESRTLEMYLQPELCAPMRKTDHIFSMPGEKLFSQVIKYSFPGGEKYSVFRFLQRK